MALHLIVTAAGGAVGSVLRYQISGLVQAHAHGGFPLGTLFVNLVGCLMIGLLSAAWPATEGGEEMVRLGVVVGGLGGFTTFSTFSAETLALFQAGRVDLAALYVGLSTGLGLVSAWAGYRAGWALAT